MTGRISAVLCESRLVPLPLRVPLPLAGAASAGAGAGHAPSPVSADDGGTGCEKIESLADLLREFNHQNDVTVAYKAFCNWLARPGFAEFMRQMLARLIEQLSIRILAPEGHAAVGRFDDIVIQDGSSFTLKKALSEVFSGRVTTIEPAAVEVHATYSGFSDEVSMVEIAADSEEERQFQPR
jgi:hypothetical protein